MKKSASNDTEDTKLEDPEDYYAMDKCQLLHEVHRLNEALLEAQMWLQEERFRCGYKKNMRTWKSLPKS